MRQAPYMCDNCSVHIEPEDNELYLTVSTYLGEDWHFCDTDCINGFVFPEEDTRFDED